MCLPRDRGRKCATVRSSPNLLGGTAANADHWMTRPEIFHRGNPPNNTTHIVLGKKG